MGHGSRIQDKNGNSCVVTPDGALLVAQSHNIPIQEETTDIPFTQYMTVNGDGVTSNLIVDGSVSPVDCYVEGNTLGDFYISRINILVSDAASVTLNRFGGQVALTNGVDFFYSNAEGEVVLANAKTNFDMIRVSSNTPATGGKNDAFLLANTNTLNHDGYNPVIDTTSLSALSYGIRLRHNSKERLGVRIKDALTVATFDVLVAGYIRRID